MTPLGSNVLLMPVTKEPTSESGIYLGSTPVVTNQSKVLAVGPKVEDVSENDTVIHGSLSGATEVVIEGIKVYLIDVDVILAVVEE